MPITECPLVCVTRCTYCLSHSFQKERQCNRPKLDCYIIELDEEVNGDDDANKGELQNK